MPYIPLLSSTLPPATPGPYKTVGYAVVRAPARAWCLPSPVFRAPSKRAGEPALRVCASTWAAYYPAERPSTSEASRLAGRDGSPNGSVPSSDETVQWMPEPVEGILSGYNRYFGSSASWLFPLLKSAAARYRIPVTANLPMKATDNPYPLVIFSHGVCGTRSTYSRVTLKGTADIRQWCRAIASEGYVVLAVEHADGSSPCVLLPDGELPYTLLNELEWQDEATPPTSGAASAVSAASLASSSVSLASSSAASSTGSSRPNSRSSGKPQMDDLYALQLDQRVRELYATHEAFSALLSSPSDMVHVDGLSPAEIVTWASSLAGNVDVSSPALAGHSFGAATVIRALEAPPDGFAPLSLRAAIALDHWFEPFPKLAHRPSIGRAPPVLAINSQEYTQDEGQWGDVLGCCRDIGAALVTILGTNHESFCDFPVIATLSPGTALSFLATIHSLSLALLEGKLGEHPLMHGPPDGGEYARSLWGGMAGRKGDVVVHLRGAQDERSEGKRVVRDDEESGEGRDSR